jgi:hypothetical protein
MNLREFWAAEAAKLRDTSYLAISTDSDELLDDPNQGAAYVLPILYSRHTTTKRCFVRYQHKWIKVIASMHTHPAFLGQNVVSGEDELFMYKTKVLLLVLTSDKLLAMLPNSKTYARFERDERKMLLNGSMQIKRDLEQITKIIKQRTES